MALPLVLVVWFAISIPLAIVTGRGIGRQAARTTEPPPSKRSALLDRLAEVELREIPRVQRALGGWVDDPYLAGELRELRAEAERLRALTSVVSTWPDEAEGAA
ncbi:MAG TPA: hypothetical protein VFT27_08730 [Actinomycetota bacterium]|nr:hypothetical protein [Actinomycetota bacterium]